MTDPGWAHRELEAIRRESQRPISSLWGGNRMTMQASEQETAVLIAEAALANAADLLSLSDDPQLAASAAACLAARGALRAAFNITDPDGDGWPE